MTMPLARQVSLSFGVLLVIALACATMAICLSFTAKHYLTRADLAHRAYEAHLKVAVDTTKLFKELQKGLFFKDAARKDVQDALKRSIAVELENIRTIVTNEIVLVGEEEIEELETLNRLKDNINRVVAQYEEMITDGERLNLVNNPSLIAEFINNPDKEKFYTEIQTALDEEIGEVEEAFEEAVEAALFSRRLALVLGLLAAITAIASFAMLSREMTRPLQRIVDGAREFAAGNYQHRIDQSIGGSLGQVASAFNDVAKLASDREHDLQGANEYLEQEVARQTAELRRTVLSLEDQKKMRQRFLADVSHELRTPLTIIQGEVDIALRGEDKDPKIYKEALKRASEAAKHTAQLVNDVLFIGRQEADQARLQLTREDLVILIRTLVDTTQGMQDEHKVDVELNFEVEPAFATVDAGRIRQVLIILLENACHYGGDQVLINLMQSPDGYVVFFKDNGPGVSKEELEYIFTRYFRGSNAAERYHAGAGLGLPVAKSIIEAHGGRIETSSKPGDGVEFKIFLPAKTALRAVS